MERDTDKIINSLGELPLRAFVVMIKNQVCFDALENGYCYHHKGKCSDLLNLVERIENKIAKTHQENNLTE
jgi:hypothetical protein